MALGKKWIEEHPEERRQYQRDYYYENIKRHVKYRKNRQHKNHKISEQEWLNCKEVFNNKCAYCGLPLNQHWVERNGELKLFDFHKEHVNHNGANDLSNCVPSCKTCNSQKWKFSLDDWYNKDNQNYIEERYNKIIWWVNEGYKKYITIKEKTC